MRRAWAIRSLMLAVSCGALIVFAAWSQQLEVPKPPLLRAMHDELERSRQISLPNLEPPYFVQYLVDQDDIFSVSAALGGVLTRRRELLRVPHVTVRVGDYHFDNGNYTGGGFNLGTRYDLGHFPLEDGYDVLRRFFWLETDSAYKSAVEILSRKRAALRNLTQGDRVDDFAHAAAVDHVRPLATLRIDQEVWTRRCADGPRSLRSTRRSRPRKSNWNRAPAASPW